MERNRNLKDILENSRRDDLTDEGVREKDVRSLTDLELVLAAGGEGVVCW